MQSCFNIFTLNRRFHHGGGLLRVIGLTKFFHSNNINYKLLSADDGLLRDFGGIRLNVNLSKTKKRICQTLVAIGLNSIAAKYLSRDLKVISDELRWRHIDTLLACEHFDITIAYLLRLDNVIKEYVCDVHGYSLQEFRGEGVVNWIKRWLLRRHDGAVFKSADAIIYPNEKLRVEMEVSYKYVNNTFFYLPYLLAEDNLLLQEDFLKKDGARIRDEFKSRLDGRRVVFFAGSFKTLSGVDDLVGAFIRSNGFDACGSSCVLFLIGDGLLRKKIIRDLERSGLEYIHISSIEYKYLRCFQLLADVIVCPEPFNLYSNLIVHLKLLDSIASGICVVSPKFQAICDMGLENKVISYSPSDIREMSVAILEAVFNEFDFSGNAKFAMNNLTYENYSLENFSLK